MIERRKCIITAAKNSELVLLWDIIKKFKDIIEEDTKNIFEDVKQALDADSDEKLNCLLNNKFVNNEGVSSLKNRCCEELGIGGVAANSFFRRAAILSIYLNRNMLSLREALIVYL